MKTKNNKQTTTIVYTNPEADTLISKELSKITEQVKTHALDLADKRLPRLKDPLSLYILMILAPFQSLLENVHKLLGADRVHSEIVSTKENYQKEEQTHKQTLENVGQDLRLLEKREKELKGNLGFHIRNWRIALIILVLLSFAETLLNYKIFLPISSNNFTALIGATGIAIALFIICHVFKDILNFFSDRKVKVAIGVGILSLVTGLLYSFAKMRLSFMSEIDSTTTETVSEWNFVILNLTLFLAGVALTLIYKPSKGIISDYNAHKKIASQIKSKQKEFNTSEKRLSILTQEKNDRLGELEGLLLMAHNYEKAISAEYEKAFALWCSENLIARKNNDDVPKCFSEAPKPLTMYFQNNQSQTL